LRLIGIGKVLIEVMHLPEQTSESLDDLEKSGLFRHLKNRGERKAMRLAREWISRTSKGTLAEAYETWQPTPSE
jgi:hypothetical protein